MRDLTLSKFCVVVKHELYCTEDHAETFTIANIHSRADCRIAGDKHCNSAGTVAGHADVFARRCTDPLPKLRELSPAGRNRSDVPYHIYASAPICAVNPRAR